MKLFLDVIAGPMIVLGLWPVWAVCLIAIVVVVTVAIIRRRKKK